MLFRYNTHGTHCCALCSVMRSLASVCAAVRVCTSAKSTQRKFNPILADAVRTNSRLPQPRGPFTRNTGFTCNCTSETIDTKVCEKDTFPERLRYIFKHYRSPKCALNYSLLFFRNGLTQDTKCSKGSVKADGYLLSGNVETCLRGI